MSFGVTLPNLRIWEARESFVESVGCCRQPRYTHSGSSCLLTYLGDCCNKAKCFGNFTIKEIQAPPPGVFFS